MKKSISLIMIATLLLSTVFLFSGCGKDKQKAFEVALITDGAPINDGGNNQSAWNGVSDYAKEKNMGCRYYQPNISEEDENTPKLIADYIDIAVKNGAKQIVLVGEKFAVPAYEVAPTYKDVQFVLLDAFPHSQDDDTARFQANVECIHFDKMEAGFLAGYTAVISGLSDAKGNLMRQYNTKLGYLGSVESQDAADYGAGYIQGAAYAADEKKVPVYMDYAEYDSAFLNYDYSFTIEPVYVKREDAKKDTFKVTVVDGIGSGVYTDGENVTITANPAPEGKTFDHWEVKSDTKGVKDKKVNISSKKETSMNLLVGDCDCTITAVWADAETVPVTVTEADGATAHEVINAVKNSSAWVEAPAAASGMVFDHWKCSDENALEDSQAKGVSVNVAESPITLTPVYAESEQPTFNVTVKNGTGSGAYVTDDEVKIVADPPQDGYMFYEWKNSDNLDRSTGIAMENEYCYHTSFKMVDRYAAVAENMFDDGAQVVFAGGCPVSDAIFTAASNFDYPVFAFGYGVDEGNKGNCLASVINDYGAAVKLALSDFKGGSVFNANCANKCLYVTGKSTEEFKLDGEGNIEKDKKDNPIKDDNYNADYAAVYQNLSESKIKLTRVQKGFNANNINKSKCLTLKYWVTYDSLNNEKASD